MEEDYPEDISPCIMCQDLDNCMEFELHEPHVYHEQFSLCNRLHRPAYQDLDTWIISLQAKQDNA